MAQSHQHSEQRVIHFVSFHEIRRTCAHLDWVRQFCVKVNLFVMRCMAHGESGNSNWIILCVYSFRTLPSSVRIIYQIHLLGIQPQSHQIICNPLRGNNTSCIRLTVFVDIEHIATVDARPVMTTLCIYAMGRAQLNWNIYISDSPTRRCDS